MARLAAMNFLPGCTILILLYILLLKSGCLSEKRKSMHHIYRLSAEDMKLKVN